MTHNSVGCFSGVFPTKSSKVVFSVLLIALLTLSTFLALSHFEGGASAQPDFLNVSIIPPTQEVPVKLGVNQTGTFTASVNNSFSGNLEYSWSITPANNNTVIAFDGAKCNLTFVQATTDPYMLNVNVKDLVVGNMGSASMTVYDPYTSPGYKFDASTATASYIISTDGLGWYRAVRGLDGAVMTSWTSTNFSLVVKNAVPLSTSIVCIGNDVLTNTIILNHAVDFTFDAITASSSLTGNAINITVPFVHVKGNALSMVSGGGWSASAVSINGYGAAANTIVEIASISSSTSTGVGVELTANSGPVSYFTLQNSRITGFNINLYLDCEGTAWINTNTFYNCFLANAENTNIKLYNNGGGIGANVFLDIFTESVINSTGTDIWLGSSPSAVATGVYDNEFDALNQWDVAYTQTAYYADSSVINTKFDGGLLSWSANTIANTVKDSGTDTSYSNCVMSDGKIYSSSQTSASIPVLYLPMDEGTGATTTDWSGCKNTGALTGTSWTTGLQGYGYALGFAGSGYINCGNQSILSLTADWTFSAWIKVNSTSENYLFTNGIYQVNGIVIEVSGGSLQAYTSQMGTSQLSGTLSGVILAGDTDFITVAKTGTSIREYVNATDVTVGSPISQNAAYSNANVIIGGSTTGQYGPPWNGIIDEVVIVNYGRSASEVYNLFTHASLPYLPHS